MIEIIPAIMPKNEENLAEKFRLLGDFSGIVQLDLMDGIFVPDKTWLPDKLPEGDFELDLMIKNAAGRIGEWLALKPKRIIFHIEAEDDLSLIHSSSEIEVGLAINITTPIEKVKPLIPQINFIQCMGIARIGFQGELLDERVFEKIKETRATYPDLPVSVDGGVNLKNVAPLIQAGANRLVAGSAIWKSADPRATLKKLQALI